MPIPNHNYPECTSCKVRYKTYFNALNHEDLELLSQHKSCVLYKKGQNIFYEGGTPHGIYCLYSGKVKSYMNSADGREQILRFIAPGDLFGIKALIENKKYTVTTSAIEDSVVCFINNRKIFELILKYPNITNYLLISLSRMLEHIEKKVASIALKTVKERVAESLLILYKTYNFENEADKVIKISREDLAYSVGSATETVIRTLSELKSEGYIEIKGRSIRILNEKALIKVGNIED